MINSTKENGISKHPPKQINSKARKKGETSPYLQKIKLNKASPHLESQKFKIQKWRKRKTPTIPSLHIIQDPNTLLLRNMSKIPTTQPNVPTNTSHHEKTKSKQNYIMIETNDCVAKKETNEEGFNLSPSISAKHNFINPLWKEDFGLKNDLLEQNLKQLKKQRKHLRKISNDNPLEKQILLNESNKLNSNDVQKSKDSKKQKLLFTHRSEASIPSFSKNKVESSSPSVTLLGKCNSDLLIEDLVHDKKEKIKMQRYEKEVNNFSASLSTPQKNLLKKFCPVSKKQAELQNQESPGKMLIALFKTRNSESKIEEYKKELTELTFCHKGFTNKSNTYQVYSEMEESLQDCKKKSPKRWFTAVNKLCDHLRNKLNLKHTTGERPADFEEFMRQRNLNFLLNSNYKDPKDPKSLKPAFNFGNIQNFESPFQNSNPGKTFPATTMNTARKTFNLQRNVVKKSLYNRKTLPNFNYREKSPEIKHPISPFALNTPENAKKTQNQLFKTLPQFNRTSYPYTATAPNYKFKSPFPHPFISNKQKIKQRKFNKLQEGCLEFRGECSSMKNRVGKVLSGYNKTYGQYLEDVAETEIAMDNNAFSFKDLKNYMSIPHNDSDEIKKSQERLNHAKNILRQKMQAKKNKF